MDSGSAPSERREDRVVNAARPSDTQAPRYETTVSQTTDVRAAAPASTIAS